MGSLPLHKKIKDFILERIEKGDFKENEQIPTEKELMELFNTSRATVRKALAELEIEKIIYRKRKSGSFVAEINPEEKKKVIGLLLSNMYDYMSLEIMEGIVTIFNEKGYIVIPEFLTGDQKKNLKKVRDFLKNKFDGFIVIPRKEFFEVEEYTRLLEKKFPVVYVDRGIDFSYIPVVQSDNYFGAYELTKRIIENSSIKKISFISYDDTSLTSVRERYVGIHDAADRNNAKVEKYIIRENELEKVIQHCLNDRTDLLFCCHDNIAISAISILLTKGIKIPDEIKVAGFDDVKIGDMIVPKLTTVKQNFIEIGRKAAEIIIDIIDGKRHDNEIFNIPVAIKLKDSTGIN